MINIGRFIKDIRSSKNLSQRKFAEFTKISFRQIQRLENNESDITIGKFYNILNKFGLDLKVIAKEPDWNVLFNFGLPLNVSDKRKKDYKYSIITENLILASSFLLENKHNADYLRYYDSFKSLLLALKTHYPSKFNDIQNQYNVNFTSNFNLNNIDGKHIKLRNICLYDLSSYFS